MLREPAVIVNIGTRCFRVVYILDVSKDTLEKETANDDIVVSVNDIKATPHNVLVQDKPVAAYNFATSTLDEDVDIAIDEINEVKAALLVKSLFHSLGAPKCPQ